MGDAYDVVVIGAGTGGYSAALRAAQLGKRVALVQRDDRLGGADHTICPDHIEVGSFIGLAAVTRSPSTSPTTSTAVPALIPVSQLE